MSGRLGAGLLAGGALASLVAAALEPGGGPGAPARVSYGVSDQSHRAFADPNFRALGVRLARIVVSYDVVERAELGFFDERAGAYLPGGDRAQPGELENLDRWMRAARARGYEPLLSLQFSRSRPRHLPSLSEYRAAVRRLLDRYAPGWEARPGRRTGIAFTPWNEPNLRAQPPFDQPRQAARYYRVLRRTCGRRCTVAAGDFAQVLAYEPGPLGICGEPPGSRACAGRRFPGDGGRLSQREYVGRYRAELRGELPRIWAYHPYGDVNAVIGGRREAHGVRALIREAIDTPVDPYERPDEVRIWLTEAGGILENSAGSLLETADERETLSPRMPAPPTAEEREQVAEVEHLVGPVAEADPRIERLYYYSFRVTGFPFAGGCRNFSGFDSGLVRECALAGRDLLGGRPVEATVRRPAYEVFRRAVAASRARRAR